MPDRLFRALLQLLPEDLRTAYAREIEATFRAERREAGNRIAIARLWAATLWDLARVLPAQHWEVFRRDAHYALRLMRRQPVQSAAAVITLALAVAANVAMFAVADAVLLQPLPYQDAGRVVLVEERAADRDPGNVGYLTFLDLRSRSRSFAALAATSQSFATLSGDGREAERLNAVRASASYLDVAGLRPAIGRAFRPEEDRPGAARRVAILGDGLWRRRFAGDPSVVGRSISVGGTPFTIVGVMPPGVNDLVAERMYGGAEIWFPLGYDPAAAFACRTCRHLRVFGRLNPGIDTRTAERELSALFASLAAEHSTQYDRPSSRVRTLADVFLGPVRPVLLVLWGGVAALLLVACLNVANLLLLRATERRHEVAVRAALGVTRGRLSRQLLTESLILAALGGLSALPPAWLAVRLVAAHGPSQLPRLADAALDARALAVCLAVTMASGALFGLVPMRQLARRHPARTLQGARGAGTVEAWRTRALLAAGSVALAAFLLVGAGLLVRTMDGLIRMAPGFDPRGVVTAEVVLSGPHYDDESPDRERALVTRFYAQVLTGLRASPDVEAASAVTTLPLGGGLDAYGLHVEGRVLPNPEEAPSAHRFVVQDGFFETLRIPLLHGRLLGSQDGAGAPRVAVIGRTTAEQVFGSENPIGHRLMLGPPTAPPRTIVGVVGDTRHEGLDTPPGLQVYVPQAQWAWAEGALTLVVRARTGDAASLARTVRQAVRHVDAGQPVSRLRGYESIVAASIGTRRFASWLLGAFSITAVLLAVVGLYGALGVTVGLRRREIGVRLAMGANAGRVRRMILTQGMRPAVLGLGAGLGLAALGVAALESLVFGVDPRDPATFAAVAVLLLTSALAACLIPVLRAGRVNPASALRTE